MKKVYNTVILLLMLVQSLSGQEKDVYKDSIATYFYEIKTAIRAHEALWQRDLYAPVLFVNPDTRQVFANFPDSAGNLKQDGKLYSGVLPAEINIANTAVNWSGKRWAMVMLPLPLDKTERVNLLAHELFHVHQPALGFKLFNVENNHLDSRNGRVYLRFELEALKKALRAKTLAEQKTHVRHALAFRKYRYSLFKGADTSENLLELNEGIAEYTGFVVSGRDRKQSAGHFEKSITAFLGNPTFVRSFAYQTVPVYGHLLSGIRKKWNRDITVKTNLTDYFIREFGILLPKELKMVTDSVSAEYNGNIIMSEEQAREEKAQQLVAEYKNKFITQAHVIIAFEQMNVSFDPRNIMPVEDKGTVYPNIRVTDNWGILTVKNGALMSPDWGRIFLTLPVKSDSKVVSGDGWVLELREGYTLIKEERTGNVRLKKVKD